MNRRISVHTLVLRLTSSLLAVIGVAAIGVSLLSFSPDVLANEPLDGTCSYPSPCNFEKEGVGCSVGQCNFGELECNPCCTCQEDTEDDDYFCLDNMECD